MAYTQQDIEALKAAMAQMARGERVRSTTMADGRRVDFSEMEYSDMAKLLDLMQRDVNAGAVISGGYRCKAWRGSYGPGY